MKYFLLSLFMIFIAISCQHQPLVITAAIVKEIINPPEAPETFYNGSVEPEVKIINTGTTVITSIAIRYNIDLFNTGDGYSVGPTTTWIGNIKPTDSTIVILDRWDDNFARPPLNKGTHMLFVNINQINYNTYRDENYNAVKRIFTYE